MHCTSLLRTLDCDDRDARVTWGPGSVYLTIGGTRQCSRLTVVVYEGSFVYPASSNPVIVPHPMLLLLLLPAEPLISLATQSIFLAI